MSENNEEVTTKMVNRDPFAPVRLTRVQNRGRGTDKFMVEMVSEDGQEWRELPGQSVVHSSNYRLVTNKQVHEMARAVMDRTGMEFKPVPSFGGGHSKALTWNGAHYVERWYAPGVMIKSPQDTDVMLGIEVRNSYDKSCKVGIAFFCLHMACSNQFFGRNLLGAPMNFAHIGTGGELDESADDAFEALQRQAEGFSRVAPTLGMLMNTRYTFEEFLDLRRAINEETGIVFRDREILDELSGSGITVKVGVAQAGAPLYGSPTTFWALANAMTAITTHAIGGLRGQDCSERAVDFLIQRAREQRL